MRSRHRFHVGPWLALLAVSLIVTSCAGPRVSPQGPGPGPGTPPPETPPPPGDVTPGQETPAPAPDAGTGPRVVFECLDVYAECPPVVGLPALSADARRVAVPDFGPDSPRDELVLTIRIVDVDSGATVSEFPVLTHADYARGVDPMSRELDAATSNLVRDRIEAAQRELERGAYRPLTFLGTVHEQRPGQVVDGLRASFDGKELVVVDERTGEVRWRRAIGPSITWKPSPDLDLVCGPFPVADVSVWASREPSVIVARVTYIGADLCATEYPYLVWR